MPSQYLRPAGGTPSFTCETSSLHLGPLSKHGACKQYRAIHSNPRLLDVIDRGQGPMIEVTLPAHAYHVRSRMVRDQLGYAEEMTCTVCSPVLRVPSAS
jgi:hypothetical protein